MNKKQSSSLTQRLLELAETWREQAEFFEVHGCTANAATALCHAEELEAVVRQWINEPLSIKRASDETGFSAEHLRRLACDGQLPVERNGGPKSRMTVRRGDLPRKRGRPSAEHVDSVDEDARRIARAMERVK